MEKNMTNDQMEANAAAQPSDIGRTFYEPF